MILKDVILQSIITKIICMFKRKVNKLHKRVNILNMIQNMTVPWFAKVNNWCIYITNVYVIVLELYVTKAGGPHYLINYLLLL